VRPGYVELDQAALELFGTREYREPFREQEAVSGHAIGDVDLDWIVFLGRHTVTPDVAKELARIWYETDVRALLPSIQVPTLLMSDGGVDDEVDHLVSLIPDASTYIHPLPGAVDDVVAIPSFVEEIRRFLGVEPPQPRFDTVVSTVLFTDIVGSTERQAAIGDHAWKDLLERHHALVREALGRYRGVENDTTGDGFFATFDGPAHAIRCAQEITERVRGLGLEVRAGIHTGECETIDEKVGGLAVTIGARVSAIASASEILVSQTVRDLVAGSGLTFADAGEHELKGVPHRWRLYRVVM
jgi:class 3 adenylate cyclase